MKVIELAKQLDTTSELILEKLKSLKLKAKDGQQELNSAVVSVLKGELGKKGKTSEGKSAAGKPKTKVVKKKVEKEAVPTPQKTVKKKKVDEEKEGSVKKTEKKTEAKTKVLKAETEDKQESIKKKVVRKKKTVSKEPSKTHSKVNKAPIITLKPLARKKRKTPASKEGSRSPAPPADTSSQGSAVVPQQDISEDLSSSKAAHEKPSPQSVELEKSSALHLTPSQGEQIVEKGDDSLPQIEIKVPITVKDLSIRIQQKPSVILKKLMTLGILTHINQNLGEDVVRSLIREFGFNYVKIKTQEEHLINIHKQEEENPDLLKPRAPVVTFMGHVDHGKTTLLDYIRKSEVAGDEHGGITQHMSAYSVKLPKGWITFLDTPGHEAFTSMRARGAHITDLVVLVVAADEGIMPQTKEAIDHARVAGVPIVVALNKIDSKNADLDRVKKQLAEVDLAPEDWGGKTVVAGVSAITGEGVDNLLELILLESELLELKANDQKMGSGTVIEAHLSQGKGAVSTLIVQSGILREGDTIVVGPYFGKVKAMFNDHGQAVKESGPSMPVEVMGLSDVAEVGELFYVVEEERQAREICLKRQEELKNKQLQVKQNVTLEDLYSHLEEESIKELRVIIKADVQGSLEALIDSLEKIPSDRVKTKIIHSGVGDVNASDVILAAVSKAVIIAFHVGIGPRAKEELKKEPVDVREYRVIYDAVDDIKNALEGLLEAKIKKNFLSRLEIREVFKLSKQGIVAGCYVTKGKVHRKANIDIVRDNEVVYSGKIGSLKRFKDDVRDVNEGMECGVTIDGFNKIEVGDIIEAYELESIAQKL